MFAQLKQHGLSIHSFPRSIFEGRGLREKLTPKHLLRAISPTFGVILLIELFFRYTGSGYSVIVITLLGVVLYTAYQSGAVLGVVSAFIVVIYNFYLIATTLHLPLLSPGTMDSGSVISVVFPVLAVIIGILKERNDELFVQEQKARVKAENGAKQLQFMAESMPQKIFTARPNGKNAYMNQQWDEYTKGKKFVWADLIHPSEYIDNMKQWEHSLKTGEPFQYEHRLKRPDGTYVWHLTRARALTDKKGKVRLWVGSTTDIEGVKKAKKLEANTVRLMKQRTQLMELNKVKDEFISLASHQLRTPATSVKQYINMVLEGYGGAIPDSARALLVTANTGNERQLAVINDLLQVAQVDSGKVVLHKEKVDIGALLTSIVRDYKSTLEKRHQTVEYRQVRREIFMNADPTKLRMAIENIVDNASKYSPPESTIAIRVTAGKEVKIHVKDHGVGIEKSDIKKIFEKFVRIDNPLSTAVGGNGLGLYLVEKIIALHGGSIWATSTLNKGSTFTIRLPFTTKT